MKKLILPLTVSLAIGGSAMASTANPTNILGAQSGGAEGAILDQLAAVTYSARDKNKQDHLVDYYNKKYGATTTVIEVPVKKAVTETITTYKDPNFSDAISADRPVARVIKSGKDYVYKNAAHPKALQLPRESYIQPNPDSPKSMEVRKVWNEYETRTLSDTYKKRDFKEVYVQPSRASFANRSGATIEETVVQERHYVADKEANIAINADGAKVKAVRKQLDQEYSPLSGMLNKMEAGSLYHQKTGEVAYRGGKVVTAAENAAKGSATKISSTAVQAQKVIAAQPKQVYYPRTGGRRAINNWF